MPPSIAPESKERVGAWGSPTSTLDWCEENYVATVVIAELCKLLSSTFPWLGGGVEGREGGRGYEMEQ